MGIVGALPVRLLRCAQPPFDFARGRVPHPSRVSKGGNHERLHNVLWVAQGFHPCDLGWGAGPALNVESLRNRLPQASWFSKPGHLCCLHQEAFLTRTSASWNSFIRTGPGSS